MEAHATKQSAFALSISVFVHPKSQGMLRMRGEYALMADADAATDISDFDRLFARMKEIERTGDSPNGPTNHAMVVGSRAHMEGEAVAKVTKCTV